MKATNVLIATLMIASLVPAAAFAQPNGKAWQDSAKMQSYVEKNVDKIESIISKVRERVTSEDFQQFLNQTRTRMQNMTQKSDFVSIAKELRDNWNDFRVRAKREINDHASDSMHGIIQNANGLARKLNSTIQKLAESGVNTTNMTADLDQFYVKINLAYGNWTLAHEKLENVSNSTDKEQVLDEAHTYLKNAQTALRDAHQILKELAREIKAVLGRPILQENESD